MYEPASPPQEPSPNYSLMTFVLSWSGMAIMSSLYVTIPLLSTFAGIFKVAPTQAAWTSSAFSICFALGCLFYGPLSDRFGRKTVILSGLAALAVISLLTGLIADLSWLIICRGLQGAAAATFSPVALAYAVDVFPAAKRVMTIGFINTGFLLAGIVGQLLSSYVSQHYGWNLIFYLLGIIYGATVWLLWRFLPRSSVPPADAGILAIFRQLGTVLTQKPLLCCYAIASTVLLSFVGMYTALSNYLSSPAFAFTAEQIFAVRSMGIVGMLLSPYAGRLVAKHGLFAVLRTGMAISVSGLLLLGISSTLISLVAASVIFVAGLAIFPPALIAIIGRLGGTARGAAVSAYTFILFAGASIGPAFALTVLATGGFPLTCLALALCLCCGLAASFFIRI